MTTEFLCEDCGDQFDGRPYWSSRHELYGFTENPLCANCAGSYLCPDFAEDATPEHRSVCVGACNTPIVELK